jgi:hypothetical protein
VDNARELDGAEYVGLIGHCVCSWRSSWQWIANRLPAITEHRVGWIDIDRRIK